MKAILRMAAPDSRAAGPKCGVAEPAWAERTIENGKHAAGWIVAGDFVGADEWQLHAAHAVSRTLGIGENVWSLFIVCACLVLPAAIITAIAPGSWTVLAHAPARVVWIAVSAGFAWGFGAIMFGQSVSAIGISLANTLVLAISSALGSLLPMLLLSPQKLFSATGKMIIAGVAIELVGIVLCGLAGRQREKHSGCRGRAWRSGGSRSTSRPGAFACDWSGGDVGGFQHRLCSGAAHSAIRACFRAVRSPARI